MKVSLFLLSLCFSTGLFAQAEPGFKPIFDGKTLNGWTLVGGHGPGYVVKDKMIVCPADGGGTLLTEAEYANFVLRFEFKLSKAGHHRIRVSRPHLAPTALPCVGTPQHQP